MTNPYSRWQNTGVQNPYAGVSAGISAPSGFSPRRNLASRLPNTTIERPDKFYAGPTERLSAKASPTVSAVQDATAAVNAATGATASPTTPDTTITPPVTTVTRPTAEETSQANQGRWLNLERVNPQSFAATVQAMALRGNLPPEYDAAVEAFRTQYSGNPWDLNPDTGQYRFGTGYYSYAPWMINPATGIPYAETERRGPGEGQLAWKGQYAYPTGSHWDFNLSQWVPDRTAGTPPTLPLTTG